MLRGIETRLGLRGQILRNLEERTGLITEDGVPEDTDLIAEATATR